MASALPGGRMKGRGHGGNAAQAVNLDTGHHIDAHGNSHRTAPGQKAMIGPDTLIFAGKMGHPPLPYLHHAKNKTNVHKHLLSKAKHPDPAELMKKHLPAFRAEAQAAMAPDAMQPSMAAGLPGGAR